MREAMKICPQCGAQSPGKFCQECGCLLESKQEVKDIGANSTPLPPFGSFSTLGAMVFGNDNSYGMRVDKPQEVVPSDEGLKLLVDCCRKTLATALGDGHDEVVLYVNENTNEYSIHTYYQAVGDKEIHRAYKTDKQFADDLMQFIDDSNIIAYKDKQGLAMCGGDIIVKFVKGEEVIRISAANFNGENLNLLYDIRSFLDKGIKKENKI